MIYEDCFALVNINGNKKCSALTKLDCKKCKFYRSKDDITSESIEKSIASYGKKCSLYD